MREKIAELVIRHGDARIVTVMSGNAPPYYTEPIEVADAILSLFKQEIEKLENKPSQYHYICWASGAVKVRDEWGDKETYKCHSFDGDFNCGYRGCKTGIIKGDKELTPIEMHENWMLQKILRVLEG